MDPISAYKQDSLSTTLFPPLPISFAALLFGTGEKLRKTTGEKKQAATDFFI